jgi:hypothetical protein
MTYLIYGSMVLLVYLAISATLYFHMRKLRKTRYIPPQTVYEWNRMSVIWPGHLAFIIFGIVYGFVAAIISFARDKFR